MKETESRSEFPVWTERLGAISPLKIDADLFLSKVELLPLERADAVGSDNGRSSICGAPKAEEDGKAPSFVAIAVVIERLWLTGLTPNGRDVKSSKEVGSSTAALNPRPNRTPIPSRSDTPSEFEASCVRFAPSLTVVVVP